MASANFIAFSLLLFFGKGAVAQSPEMERGMQMSANAYEAVCWYENIRIFPETNEAGFRGCMNQSTQNVASLKAAFPPGYDDNSWIPSFGRGFPQVMGALPSDYATNCNQFLQDATAEPANDQSAVLNDKPGQYPFKAFAYCLMDTLASRQGATALQTIASERTVTQKEWMKTILDRENEFRNRHSAPPLAIDNQLNQMAQAWADQIAQMCHPGGPSIHNPDDSPLRLYQGDKNKRTGQNVWQSSGPNWPRPIAALHATDSWYEENRRLPGYPMKYEQLELAGHFSQSVWKGSKLVGYGYTFNPKCRHMGPGQAYVVSVYYPQGNLEQQFFTADGKMLKEGTLFAENVLPPKF